MNTLKHLGIIAAAVGLIAASGGPAQAGSMVNNRATKKAGYLTVAVYAKGDTHMEHRKALRFSPASPAPKKAVRKLKE
jgi:hypothetical protein